MKIVTVVTATRAEYGLLKPLIAKLIGCGLFTVRIVATGAHLSEKYGSTFCEIEADGFTLDEKIPILAEGDTPGAVSATMGNAVTRFGEYFDRKPCDILVLLGDRYETEAIACAALNARIPIAHLYGGETTEGAVDEAYRHSITKMSWLHFTSTSEYRKRVIQLGEAPDRVFHVGSLGVENALHTDFMSTEELGDSISFKLDQPFAVVTFHPVTLEKDSARQQITELLAALESRPEMRYIITGSNADAGGREINDAVRNYVQNHNNAVFVASLGMRRYMSALHSAAMVIGNSSSGIMEAPSFHIPTINIGDRQKGRIRADSIIDCDPTRESILAAMDEGHSTEFREICANTVSPFGDGHTSERIVEKIDKALRKPIDLKKKFYDIDFTIDGE